MAVFLGNNKLYIDIPSVIKKDYLVVQALRRNDVVLTRLHIGHTPNTHSYLL